MLDHLAFQVSELQRLVENLLRPGTVAAADYAQARLKVTSGALRTGWLPWLTQRAGGDRVWWAPEVGEQVLLLCPGGKPECGVVLPAIYSNHAKAPEKAPEIAARHFKDGTVERFKRSSSHYSLSIPAGGAFEVKVGGSVFELTNEGLKINTSGSLSIPADGTFEVKAGASVFEITSGGVKIQAPKVTMKEG